MQTKKNISIFKNITYLFAIVYKKIPLLLIIFIV